MSKLTAKEIEDYTSHCNFEKSIIVSKITAYVMEKDIKTLTLRSIPVYENQLFNNIKMASKNLVVVPSDGRYGIFFKIPIIGTTFEEFKSGEYEIEYELYKNEEKEKINNLKDFVSNNLNFVMRWKYINFFCDNEEVEDFPSEEIEDIADGFSASYKNYDYEENFEDEAKN